MTTQQLDAFRRALDEYIAHPNPTVGLHSTWQTLKDIWSDFVHTEVFVQICSLDGICKGSKSLPTSISLLLSEYSWEIHDKIFEGLVSSKSYSNASAVIVVPTCMSVIAALAGLFAYHVK